MKDFTNIITGIVATVPIILILLKIFATEYMTNFTKDLFNSKTKTKANLIFNAIVVFSIVIAISYFLSPYTSSPIISSNTTEVPDTLEQQPEEEPIKEEEQQASYKKSDAEVISDGAKLLIDIGKESIHNKKKKDSAIIAGRGKKLVLQIGDIKDNEEAVLELYQKLEGIPRIFVFKKSRNRYFVYKNDGYTEEEINNSLSSFQNQIAHIEPMVKITDLYEDCKAKEDIVETKPLRFRRKKIEIPCFNCDK